MTVDSFRAVMPPSPVGRGLAGQGASPIAKPAPLCFLPQSRARFAPSRAPAKDRREPCTDPATYWTEHCLASGIEAELIGDAIFAGRTGQTIGIRVRDAAEAAALLASVTKVFAALDLPIALVSIEPPPREDPVNECPKCWRMVAGRCGHSCWCDRGTDLVRNSR